MGYDIPVILFYYVFILFIFLHINLLMWNNCKHIYSQTVNV